jgi:hypothetical protein
MPPNTQPFGKLEPRSTHHSATHLNLKFLDDLHDIYVYNRSCELTMNASGLP